MFLRYDEIALCGTCAISILHVTCMLDINIHTAISVSSIWRMPFYPERLTEVLGVKNIITQIGQGLTMQPFAVWVLLIHNKNNNKEEELELLKNNKYSCFLK